MRYPTRNGLIISPYELGLSIPTEEQLNTRRRVTRHHGYFTRANYNSSRVHSVFRNLVTNTFDLLAEEHENLHHDFDAPIKPRETVMIDVIEEYLSLHGTVDCIREKRTHDIYHISPDEWASTRGRHGVQNVHGAGNSLSYI